MNLDLLKNIAEQIKDNDNVKEFMQDLSESLENRNKQNQELQEDRKEGHLYLVTEDRNGEVYLWDFTDKPEHEFKEVITSEELLKVAKEGAMLQYKDGKYELYSENGYDMLEEAEKKITILLEKDGELKEEKFDANE